MIDVKKLVTGFLVLAVAVSASALLISAVSGGSANANVSEPGGSGVAIVAGGGGAAAGATANAQQSAGLSGDAFLPPSAAQNSADALAAAGGGSGANDPTNPALASTTDAMMSDPHNLTNILANTYLNNLALTNPNGVAAAGSGDQTLTPPDPNTVIAQFESSSSPASVQAPNWDTEADQVPVTIVSSSPNAVASYGSALANILNQDITQANLQGLLNNNSDPSAAGFAEGKVTNALQDISGLQTPTSAVAFQKSLIKVFVYAKNTLALAENASNDADPVETTLILQVEQAKYQSALQDLQTEVQKAQSQNLFLSEAPAPKTNGVFAGIQAIIGVQVANAQGIPVTDPVAETGVWLTVANLIKAYANDILLQIAKNTLIFLMQKTVYAWIQGGSKHEPAFIQNWAMTLANAYTQTALGALNSQMSCVTGAPFAPQLRLTLGATYQPGNTNVCAVQFQNNLSGKTLTNFYNNFSSGGWLTFGSTLQPDNNYYGSVFFTAQAVANTAQNAQNAAQAKAIANQGFTGTGTCDDNSDPNGSTWICSNGSFQEKADCASSSGGGSSGSSCVCDSAGYSLVQIPNNGYCADGTEPQVTTPGQTTQQTLAASISSNFGLVENANSPIGLAGALFTSVLTQLLNSLANTAITSAQGLLQQASTGGGASQVSPDGSRVTQGANAPQPITCIVLPDPLGNPDTAQLNATGGEVLSASGASTPSYTWSQPAGGTLSAPTGATVSVTFNLPGTYQVAVNDFPDGTSGVCSVAIPYQN